MTDLKTTTIRFPMPTFQRLAKVLEQTHLPMNDAVTLCVEAVLDLIEAPDGTTPPTPGIVGIARTARAYSVAQAQYAESTKKMQADVSNWEANRAEILKAAKAKDVPPAIRDVVNQYDGAMKRGREILESLQKLSKKN